MFKLKVRKIGGALGVVFPTTVIERLQVEEGQTFFLIEGPDHGYRPTRDETLVRAEDIIGRHRNTLDVLAK